MAEATVSTKPDTIVFIHGLWMTPRSWEHWKERYEDRGYTVHAPAWPGFEVEVEALNADPSPMDDLRADTVIDAYESFIRELPSSPIIIGHSLGGAVTQVLLNRGLGSVGVGVSSATVKGIRDLPWSTLKAAGPALNPLKRGKPVPLSEKEFHYAFANTMSEEESKRAVRALCRAGGLGRARRHRAREPAPEPAHRRRLREGGPDPAAVPRVQRGPRRPAEGHDAQRAKYDDSVSITEYKEFEGRPHFPGAPGWEEVADFAIDWAERHAGLTVSEHAAQDASSTN